jgi:hypothetical protein
VRCVIQGCSSEFGVYSSYTSHMSREHKCAEVIINRQFLSNIHRSESDNESDSDTGVGEFASE